MRVVHRVSAPDHTEFSPTALAGRVGGSVPLRAGDRVLEATLVSAAVALDGSWVELTLDVPGLESVPGLEVRW